MDGFLLLTILIAVAGFAWGTYEAKIKGILGEKKVAVMLARLPHNQYRVFNDVLIKGNYGMTQIDHVVLSTHGIFVIETKNYKGWISGGEYSDFWTKNMYGKKFKFRNPLMQNYAHIKTLSEILFVPEDMFISIVAFSSQSELNVNATTPVIYISHILDLMKQYTDDRLQAYELNMLEKNLNQANIKSKEARKEHVEQIRTKVRDNRVKVATGICPRCGGQLVRRRGRTGAFMGCSSYPKCRYTSNF